MAAASQEVDEEITAINVTPLVDIALVLLIIFMVTANFIVRETMEVDLPRAANAGETVQGLINVVMDKDGALFLDGIRVSEGELLFERGVTVCELGRLRGSCRRASFGLSPADGKNR